MDIIGCVDNFIFTKSRHLKTVKNHWPRVNNLYFSLNKNDNLTTALNCHMDIQAALAIRGFDYSQP